MSAKRTSWNEFSSSMASVVICLSIDRKFNFSKYIFDSLVRNVDSSSKFYMYPRFLQLMIRAQVSDLSLHTKKYSSSTLTQKVFANMRKVGKGFSGVETPLLECMIVAHQADDVADELLLVLKLMIKVEALEQDKVAQALEIIELKQRVKKLERKNKLKVSRLRRLRKVGTAQRVKSSADTDVADDKVEENADVHGRPEESQAQIYKIDLEHADNAARRRKGVVIRDPEETATPSTIVHSEPKSKDKGKGILVEEPKPLKKQAQIEQDEAYARELEAELNKNINWDDVIEHVKEKGKQDNAVLRYQALKSKPETEA
nr:hypothetical protein [Tanacetum cinerariifolium]